MPRITSSRSWPLLARSGSAAAAAVCAQAREDAKAGGRKYSPKSGAAAQQTTNLRRETSRSSHPPPRRSTAESIDSTSAHTALASEPTFLAFILLMLFDSTKLSKEGQRANNQGYSF